MHNTITNCLIAVIASIEWLWWGIADWKHRNVSTHAQKIPIAAWQRYWEM